MQRQGEVGGGGKAQGATGRCGRRRDGTGSHRERGCIGSHREMWEAVGRHKQEVKGGAKAYAATGSGGRRRDGTGSDTEKREAEGRHRQRY